MKFPLTVTEDGYYCWCAGKTRWICSRKKSRREALAIYHRKAAAWTDGEAPIVVVDHAGDGSPTVHVILGKWLLDRRAEAQRGELGGGSFMEYKRSAKRINAAIGHMLTDDVSPDVVKQLYAKLHARHGEEMSKRILGHFRAAARYAADMNWCRPLRLGSNLIAKLTAREQPKMKWRLYTPVEIGAILAACDKRIAGARGGFYRDSWVQLKAMILLALNGGYGATELSQLTKPVVDLNVGLIDHARGKTGEQHVVPLWPETIDSLKPVLAQRQKDELLFRTRSGNPWTRVELILKAGKLVKTNPIDNVNWAFGALVRPLGLKIPGQGFYKLRHLHATTVDAAGDPHATFTLAGHALPGSRSPYVRVGLDRVRKVVEYARHVILNPSADPQSASASKAGRAASSGSDTRARRQHGRGAASAARSKESPRRPAARALRSS
jgi:integrase